MLLLRWLTLLLLPAMNGTVESWRMKILQPSVIAQKAVISRLERNDCRRLLLLLLLLQWLRIGWLSFRHRPEYRELLVVVAVLDLFFFFVYFWMVQIVVTELFTTIDHLVAVSSTLAAFTPATGPSTATATRPLLIDCFRSVLCCSRCRRNDSPTNNSSGFTPTDRLSIATPTTTVTATAATFSPFPSFTVMTRTPRAATTLANATSSQQTHFDRVIRVIPQTGNAYSAHSSVCVCVTPRPQLVNQPPQNLFEPICFVSKNGQKTKKKLETHTHKS